MERLARKFETARSLVPRPVVVQTGKSKIGFIAFGTSDFAITRKPRPAEKEYGLDADYLRIRAFPFAAKYTISSLRTIASTSSSRTATRRC